MAVSAGPVKEFIEITAHCLLRYYVALSLEAARIDHSHQRADRELNLKAGRVYTAKQWLDILEPYYTRRFSPGESTAHLREERTSTQPNHE